MRSSHGSFCINPNRESDQRKQQNRLAQREFRQRKQAYVKELEVRVNLLARSKDEQLEGMKVTIRTLVEENQQLREVLGHLGRFIGSGLGGCLPEIGLSPLGQLVMGDLGAEMHSRENPELTQAYSPIAALKTLAS
ncbi:BQ2448_4550 [Microbotryum intermedium]|uniref:BQ2448_4550 protein n=1 Tax=Microbotryum intermedium TaxID=269621 RepID=A0A238FLA4_9BASI|nr:BQ2448_4550 [Microbotryum intermedium]